MLLGRLLHRGFRLSTALGLGLAVLYQRARSLLAPIAMHATFNAISLTLALLDRLYHWNLPT